MNSEGFKETEIGLIPEEWDYLNLGELCKFVTGKLNSNMAEEGGIYPFFTCSPEILSINSYSFDTEAILLAGNNAEGKFNVKYYNGKFNVYQRTYVITIKDLKKLNYSYLYFALILSLDRLRESSQGTATKFLTMKILNDMELPLPRIEEQTKIGQILKELDKKIELNQEMNRTLAAIVQAIFRQWFVHFEFPTSEGGNYKSSGGEMVDSELGKIPVGWEVGYVNDLIENAISGDWGKEANEEDFSQRVFCIRGADIPNIALGSKSKAPIRYIKSNKFEKCSLNKYDIIMEISGGSPTQSTGRAVIITQDILKRYNNQLICSNFCKILRCTKEYYSTYLINLINHLYDKDFFFQYENGTTGIKNLDFKSLFKYEKFVIPPENVLNLFHSIIESFSNVNHNNGLESATLIEIRDTLLPKLMSGKIRVNIKEEVTVK